MVYLNHSIFRLILSFKDPRYELVRNGGQTDSARCVPVMDLHDCKLHYGRDWDVRDMTPQIILWKQTPGIWESITIVKTFNLKHCRDSYYTYGHRSRRLVELSMQCEACGDEELFVHNYKKHTSGSNKP